MNQSPTTDAPEALSINIDAVLRSRMPRHYRFMPRPLIRWVERLICQDQLNAMLLANRGKRGAEFCRGVLHHLGITLDVEGLDTHTPEEPRVVIVSNHPLGGLDGMALIDIVERHYRRAPKFVVNDLLMAVEPLSDVFVPINKHGAQSREAIRAVAEAFDSDAPVIIFPAGLVSRKQPGGEIADLQWQKTFVNLCLRYHRDVIPAHFIGRNSSFFYNFARLRTRLGLKFNIEMVRLPKEVFLARNSRFRVVFGPKVSHTRLRGGADAQATADSLRSQIYALTPNASNP